MSLVDITPLPAEDEMMDPATKQYLDSSQAVAEARSDAKLAEFRATMEAYTARADEREAAAKERERSRSEAFERRMDAYTARADEREATAKERERIRAEAFERRMDAYAARADEREAAAREREALAREREELRFTDLSRKIDTYALREDERHAASLARFDQIERRLDRIEISVAGLKKFVVGASLSTVLGVAAFNAALTQNYHAAFDSSHYLSAAEQDMAAQRKRSEALLSAMEARLAAMQKMSGQ